MRKRIQALMIVVALGLVQPISASPIENPFSGFSLRALMESVYESAIDLLGIADPEEAAASDSGLMGNIDPAGFEAQPEGLMGNIDPAGLMGNIDPAGLMGNIDPAGLMGNIDPAGAGPSGGEEESPNG